MNNRIKAIRKNRELTQEQFAKMLDVDQTAVSNWETQKNNPDISVATALSEKTNLPLDFIYGKKFDVTVPIDKWTDDQREDFESANPEAKEVLMFRFGRGVFCETEQPNNENGAAELSAFLDELKNRPEMRMLFSLAQGATKEDVEKAVAIIKALKNVENE